MQAAQDALAIYEAKGDKAGIAGARALVASLSGGASAGAGDDGVVSTG